MSAATASSTETVTVYVRLRDEAVEAWRPVQARRLGQAIFRLADAAIPSEETWTFQPGDTVVAEPRPSAADGAPLLVAVARASDLDAASQAAYRLAS